MSKPVTSAAVLTLADKGLLSLDDRVEKFIPGFGGITIRHLLTMTSGIPYFGGGPDAATQKAYKELSERFIADEKRGAYWSTLELTREIAKCPVCFEPGRKWMYGLGIDVAGAVVCVVTGMELGDYMKEVLFDPLGMRDTSFLVPPEKQNRVLGIYTDGLEPWAGDGIYMTNCGRAQFGGAGLHSTIDDYMKFARMLLHGGDGILSEKAVAEMHTQQLTREQMEGHDWVDEKGYGYGLAVRVMIDPEHSDYDEAPGAFGWNGMTGVSVRIDQARDTAALFFTQRVPPNHADYLPAFAREVAKPVIC
jgi:CubicO group peptidase (beta-lactamase class C family)